MASQNRKKLYKCLLVKEEILQTSFIVHKRLFNCKPCKLGLCALYTENKEIFSVCFLFSYNKTKHKVSHNISVISKLNSSLIIFASITTRVILLSLQAYFLYFILIF